MDAYSYSISFFYIALEQIADEEIEYLKHNAIATRGAKIEDFEGFLNSFKKKKIENEEADHKANMAMLNRKM